MSILTGPFSMLLAALLFSGADKLFRPASAARALVTAELVSGSPSRRPRTSRALAQSLGLLELGVGVGVAIGIVVWEPNDVRALTAVLLVAAIYLGFAGFLRRIEAISPGASCGCFGSESVSGPLHIAVNLAAAGLAVAMAVSMVLLPSDQSLGNVLSDPATALLFAAVAIIGGLMVLLAPSLMTELRRAKSGSSHSVPEFTISKRLRP